MIITIILVFIIFVLLTVIFYQYKKCKKIKQLKVKYGNLEINHQTVKKEQVQVAPTVIIPEEHYLLIYDRNPAVNPARIHMLTDIKDKYNRKDIFPYIGPAPPANSGVHNYIFLLCKGTPPYAPTDRNGFNPTTFYMDVVATNYFFIDTTNILEIKNIINIK
jgi:hypothetical protein